MANIKSAIKRIKTSAKKKKRNGLKRLHRPTLSSRKTIQQIVLLLTLMATASNRI